jgi:hypothetical protein
LSGVSGFSDIDEIEGVINIFSGFVVELKPFLEFYGYYFGDACIC